jgi:predicted porin
MKKSLFALAAATAFTGAAQAQSSVTVYGILDAGYQGSSAANSVASTSTGNTITRTTTNSFANSPLQTSRLGFRGTEDLGGGMRSFFTIELGLAPMNGNLSGGSTVSDTFQNTSQGSGSAIDNRQTFVGLGQKGIGQFALGRQYTPVFTAGAATSPGQYNNQTGDVIYQNNTAMAAASGMSAGQSMTNRASNAITVLSDRVAGFRLGGMYALAQGNTTLPSNVTTGASTTNGGGNVNWSGWGLGADYTWQKLYVAAAYQSFKTQYTNPVWINSAGVMNISGAAATGGSLTGTGQLYAASNINDKQFLLGATYDFGILKAFAQYTARNIIQNTGSNTLAGAPTMARTAQQIGARSFVTPKVELWGSVGNGSYQGANTSTGVAGPKLDFTGYQVGTNYWMSKRTNVYAILGGASSASNIQGTTSVSSGAGNAATYAAGLRHTF